MAGEISDHAAVFERLDARIFHGLQRLARRRGWDLHSHRVNQAGFGELLTRQRVDLVLDVGAAIGMYGQSIRAEGYSGRICSFEPLTAPFRQLERTAGGDPDWTCHQLALGAEPGAAEINVSGNFDSSSLLPMHDRHERGYPESAYIGKESIEVSTVDAIWDEVAGDAERTCLKLDVQGFELEALRGADGVMPSLHAVQVELSLVPLYEGGPLWTDLIGYLRERGLRIAHLAPAFADATTGELLQVDGFFTRNAA
jgi:FkbM family methyltransferase